MEGLVNPEKPAFWAMAKQAARKWGSAVFVPAICIFPGKFRDTPIV